MKIIIKLLILFLFCIAFKFSYNYTRYRKTIKLSQKYLKWLSDYDSVENMTTYKQDILKLFKQAKVEDMFISVAQNVGFGKVTTSTCSIADNLFTRRKDIAAGVLELFDAVIGYYRSAYKSAFSPLYWIETIVFLPKVIIEYIGADLEKTAVRVVNVILTALWWIFATVITLYKVEIINVLQSLLNKLTQ